MNQHDNPEPERNVPLPGSQGSESWGRRTILVALLCGLGLAIVGYASGWLGVPQPPSPNETVPAAASTRTAAKPLSYSVSADRFVFNDEPVAVPDLAFVDGSGRSLKLSDLRGRSIVLNIWANWCVPCLQEMPSLDRLQAKFAEHDVLVLALSSGDASEVQEFYQELGLHSLGIYVYPAGGAVTKLGLPGLPGTLLIDASGKEIGRKFGAAEWDRPEIMDALVERFDLPPPVATTKPAG